MTIYCQTPASLAFHEQDSTLSNDNGLRVSAFDFVDNKLMIRLYKRTHQMEHVFDAAKCLSRVYFLSANFATSC